MDARIPIVHVFPTACALRGGNRLISREPQVLDLLEFLIRSRDRVVSGDDPLAAVWPDASSRMRR